LTGNRLREYTESNERRTFQNRNINIRATAARYISVLFLLDTDTVFIDVP